MDRNIPERCAQADITIVFNAQRCDDERLRFALCDGVATGEGSFSTFSLIPTTTNKSIKIYAAKPANRFYVEVDSSSMELPPHDSVELAVCDQLAKCVLEAMIPLLEGGAYRMTSINLFLCSASSLAEDTSSDEANLRRVRDVLMPFAALRQRLLGSISVQVSLFSETDTPLQIENESVSNSTHAIRELIQEIFSDEEDDVLLAHTAVACRVYGTSSSNNSFPFSTTRLLADTFILRRQFRSACLKRLQQLAVPSSIIGDETTMLSLLAAAPTKELSEERYTYLFYCTLLSPLIPLRFFIAMACAHAPFKQLFAIVDDLRKSVQQRQSAATTNSAATVSPPSSAAVDPAVADLIKEFIALDGGDGYQVSDVAASIKQVLKGEGNTTGCAITATVRALRQWVADNSAATTTGGQQSSSSKMYVGKPAVAKSGKPAKGKAKPFWHCRLPHTVKQPFSNITTAPTAASSSSSASPAQHDHTTIIVFEDSVLHPSIAEMVSVGSLTPLEGDFEAIIQKILIQRPTNVSLVVEEVRRLADALDKEAKNLVTNHTLPAVPEAKLQVAILEVIDIFRQSILGEESGPPADSTNKALISIRDLFHEPLEVIFTKSSETLKTQLTEDAAEDDELDDDEELVAFLSGLDEIKKSFSHFYERFLTLRASAASSLMGLRGGGEDEGSPTGSGGGSSSHSSSNKVVTGRDVQMWNAGFVMGKRLTGGGGVTGAGAGVAPKKVKEAAQLPPPFVPAATAAAPVTSSSPPPETGSQPETVSNRGATPTNSASASLRSPPSSETAQRFSVSATAFTPKPSATPFVPSQPNSAISRAPATGSLSAAATEFRPPTGGSTTPSGMDYNSSNNRQMGGGGGGYGGPPPPFPNFTMPPMNMNLAPDSVNKEMKGPYLHGALRTSHGYLQLSASESVFHFNRECPKDDVRLHVFPLALAMRVQTALCTKCVPKDTSVLNDSKMITCSTNSASVFAPEIGGDRQASRFSSDEALYLHMVAKGTARDLDSPTDFSPTECMSLVKFVVVCLARARIHAERTTKSRKYEIKVKLNEIPSSERSMYDKLIFHISDALSMANTLLTSPSNEVPTDKRGMLKLRKHFMLGSACFSYLHSLCYRMTLESTRFDCVPLTLGRLRDYECFSPDDMRFASECALNFCHPIWVTLPLKSDQQYPCRDTGKFYCEMCSLLLEREDLTRHFAGRSHLQKLNSFELPLKMEADVGAFHAKNRDMQEEMQDLPELWRDVAKECNVNISEIEDERLIQKAVEKPPVPGSEPTPPPPPPPQHYAYRPNVKSSDTNMAGVGAGGGGANNTPSPYSSSFNRNVGTIGGGGTAVAGNNPNNSGTGPASSRRRVERSLPNSASNNPHQRRHEGSAFTDNNNGVWGDTPEEGGEIEVFLDGLMDDIDDS